MKHLILLILVAFSASAHEPTCASIFETFASNPIPENGIFSKAVPEIYADDIVAGRRPLSRKPEAFIGAADDLLLIQDARELATILTLYEDWEATAYKDTSDWVVLKFRFVDEMLPPVSSPIDPEERRGYGYLKGGKTRGGAREWIIDSASNLKGMIEFVE